LLSLIAGLDQPTIGDIRVSGHATPALMFQEPALFPWLSVRDNVALPLRLRGIGRRERTDRAHELLQAVHLEEFAGRRPHQLSGGMRQRVALARTLALSARAGGTTPILLMDEPFGALDAMTRDLLHDELERVWMERRLTVIFVTHNVREAARLGNRIVLLSSRPGRVIADYPVHAGRPRRIDSPDVSGIAAAITDDLRAEVSRHGH
jgi:NitT/TauT family transport system ATP-binding protein